MNLPPRDTPLEYQEINDHRKNDLRKEFCAREEDNQNTSIKVRVLAALRKFTDLG